MKEKVKQWFINHRPSKRRLIQIYAALLYNANLKGFITGNIYTSATTKYMCVPGLNCYSCPGAVGACPLGALQNALAESGTRAPYYILGILALFGLMFARTVCGFLCPIGLCQELLYKIRTPKLKKSRATRVFSFFKYVLLILAIALPLIYAMRNLPLPSFCKYICPAGTFGGAIMLLLNPNNSGLFAQIGAQFTWKFGLLVVFIVASVFIFRFFCRFFCPLGAIYGFFNRFSLLGVRVNTDDCTNCGLCISHCKMDTKRVGDHECINCGECISVCPTKAISWKGSQIFLHKDAIDEVAPTVAPLVVENGVVSIPQSGEAYQTPQADASQTGVYEDTVQNATVQTPVYYEKEETFDKFKPDTDVKSAKKPKKPTKFWLEMTAWILALVILVGAIVYFNFIDVDKYTPTGYQVGDTAPDFTVQLYNEDVEFNLNSNRGKVTVINFWATWCGPCKEEMPYFVELAETYSDINVITIHSDDNIGGSVEREISRQGWSMDALKFAQDNMDNTVALTYRSFGGTGLLPKTVVVDEDGIILYNSTKSFESYEELIATLGAYLGVE